MGRVKDHYWDQICSEEYQNDIGPEPDLLEMLAADAELAVARYHAELAKRNTSEGNNDKSV